jgi:hypothetical protein
MIKINFDTLKFSRTRILELTDGLTVEQFNKIPNGLKHNIVWTMGHILASQQLFMYKRTSLPFTVKEEIVEKYKSGTAATTNVSKEEIDYLIKALFETLEQVQLDYENGKYKQFDSFVTKRGVEISTIEDAIAFHTYHEGIHVGWIWMMKNLL